MRPHLKYNIIELWHSLQEKHDFLCPWWREKKWYSIKCWFKPKNKWATKAISNQWQDLDTVYVNVLFAGIINYVEGEKCFETIMWVTPQEKRYKKKIEEIYKWAKTGRKELQDKIENAYPPFEVGWMTKLNTKSQQECKEDYEKLYGEVNRLEKLLYDTDTQYLTWLVTNRNVLWT